MKRLIIITIMLVITGSMYAQNNRNFQIPSPEEHAKKTVEELAKKIPLTSTQKDSSILVFTEFFTNMYTYRTDGNKDLIQYIEKTRNNKMKALLKNEEQYTAYLKFLQDQKTQHEKAGRPDMPGNQNGNPPPDGNFNGEMNEGFQH